MGADSLPFPGEVGIVASAGDGGERLFEDNS
jgi:hypothetical protein